MNILVVRTDKLGDFITALPTLYALKQHDPRNKVFACVAPLNEELAEACDFIDGVIVDEGGSLWKFSRKLKKAKIDASVTLFSNTRVALAQFLARIPVRIAPATKAAQLFYTNRIRQRRSSVKMAEYEYNLELATALFPGIDLSFRSPLLRFEKKEIEEAYRKFCDRYGVTKPVVAFHPGFGGSSDANWTLDEYVELVKVAAGNPEVQAVMTFGPGEEELYRQSVDKCEGLDVIFYRSREGIVAFAALLASFRLFVSTSTGTYHLAAAVGTPTMTFFADSLFASVKRWKAVSDERLQHPYMLSSDEARRLEQFETVKRELAELLV
jgi:ADP-heptose:LPS heptosyltransferase